MRLFGSFLDNMETPKKKQEKAKAKKHRKKWKARDVEKNKKLCLSIRKENVLLYETNTNNPVFKKGRRLKRSKSCAEDWSCLGYDEREFCKEMDSSVLEFFTEKKGKKGKVLQDFECIDGTQELSREAKHKQYYKMCKVASKSQSPEKQMCLVLPQDFHISRKGKPKKPSQGETPWLQTPRQSRGLDSTVHSFQGSAVKGFKENRKLRKEALCGASRTEANSCASNTEPLLSLTPTTLEFKACNFKEDFSIGGLKDNEPRQMGSDPEAISSSFGSQDLFITQKSFFPLHVPSKYSSLCPPNILERSFYGSNSSGPLQASEMSAERETFEKCFPMLPCSLTPSQRKEQIPSSRDCAVQTDDFFGSSTVTSFFIRKKQFADCHEQPLDLRLPCRIQSSPPNTERISHCSQGSDDGFHTSPRAQSAIPVLDGKSENVMHSRKAEDIKYIQTQLNSSYFFKIKGDPDATVSRTPLVKVTKKKRGKNNCR